MPKRLVLCCDGTWNTPDEMRGSEPAPTNVTKIALAVAPKDSTGVEQRIFYHQGVGTNPRERISGGAFGFGLSRNVRDTYRFLVQNFEPGDKLYFFGFSRGAFTARSTVGLSGIVEFCGASMLTKSTRRMHFTAAEAAVPIRAASRRNCSGVRTPTKRTFTLSVYGIL